MKKNIKTDWKKLLTTQLLAEYQTSVEDATVSQIHNAISEVAMAHIAEAWYDDRTRRDSHRRAYYVSAEFLMGRLVHNNLYALGILKEIEEAFKDLNIDIAMLEDVEDAALGNGGLGRLAACFLDSAASHAIPLDGYGLRYRYGLFKQEFFNGYQVENADDWQKNGDPWSIRRERRCVKVRFNEHETVNAIPYDMPVIGYKEKSIGTLRLWQAEPVEAFDFSKFNDQEYEAAVKVKNKVEDITRVLYPNDSTPDGKKLRLKQQYFLSSASLQDILYSFQHLNGDSYEKLADLVAVQLNDTHPTVSIPELVRLLMLRGMMFDKAFDIASKVFSYTNHTIMSEALEKWDVELFRSVLPEIYDIICKINERMCSELEARGFKNIKDVSIVKDNFIHMANLAVYGGRYVNGVARIHSNLIKETILSRFYEAYPERFQNKTNGVTQRRWLGLCNRELSDFITERIGDKWVTDFSEMDKLKKFMGKADLEAFRAIKTEKKRQLAEYVLEKEGVQLPSSFLFDVQVKRMHEYKRQLLNAFSIVHIYFGLKEGWLVDFAPTCFVFGAKAAPGYYRAKGVIKFINDLANIINKDKEVNDKLRVVFVSNYNCSYAEKIIPAADVSEQISPAGTEASGTGNMKLMINGAVTLGTFDGATVEIVEEAGEENNYIFGNLVDDLRAIADTYSSRKVYESEPRVKRIVDTLVDGKLFPTQDIYRDLHKSLLDGESWHRADNYFVLLELLPYIEAKLRANRDYKNAELFSKKCLMNVASSGKFSSDRTILEYAKEIWHVEPLV